MAVTRLKRKAKRNIVRAKNKRKTIQRLKSQPVIKNIDVEAVKAEFSKKGGMSAKSEDKEVKEEKPKKAKPKKKD